MAKGWRAVEALPQNALTAGRHMHDTMPWLGLTDSERAPEALLQDISKNQHFLFHLIQSYYILFLLFWG